MVVHLDDVLELRLHLVQLVLAALDGLVGFEYELLLLRRLLDEFSIQCFKLV